MTALVMGATGNVGGAVVTALARRGVAVRAVSRTARSWPEGVDGVVADPNEPQGLDAAAEGVDGVFLMSGYPAEAALLRRLEDARVVVLSASSSVLATNGNAMGRMHLDSERAVQDSVASWTVLRPCSFQANALRWRDQLASGDVVRGPFADVPVAVIDPTDIGEVAALALCEPGHAGSTYRLSGPRALTPPEQLAVLAAELGRPLSFQPVEDERSELPPEYAEAMLEIFRGHPELESEVQDTVTDLLDRPAGRFEDWVVRHRQEFG